MESEEWMIREITMHNDLWQGMILPVYHQVHAQFEVVQIQVVVFIEFFIGVSKYSQQVKFVIIKVDWNRLVGTRLYFYAFIKYNFDYIN